MKFFEAVPDELFSPLASPNRALYADALDVLYTAYREKLKLPEDMLYSMLRSRLEQQLAEARAQYEATLGQADAGNLDAVAMLDDVASTYLELQKELTGAATYAPVFDDVLAELRRVKEELAAIKGNTRAGAEASAASGAVVAEAVEASARLAAQQAGYEAAARGRYVAAL